MEAMRTPYAKKRDWVSKKQTKQTKHEMRHLFLDFFSLVRISEYLYANFSYASPQKLARPLVLTDHLHRGPAGKAPRQQLCCALCSAWRGWWSSWTSPALCWSLNTCSPSWTPCRYSAQGSRGWYTVRAGETRHRGGAGTVRAGETGTGGGWWVPMLTQFGIRKKFGWEWWSVTPNQRRYFDKSRSWAYTLHAFYLLILSAPSGMPDLLPPHSSQLWGELAVN